MQLQRELDVLLKKENLLENEPLVEYARKWAKPAVDGGCTLEDFVTDVKALVPERKLKSKVELKEVKNTSGEITGMGDEYSDSSVYELDYTETIPVEDSKKEFLKDIKGS